MNVWKTLAAWWAGFEATPDKYGFTDIQRDDILWHARRGERGRDFAEELAYACGLDPSQFYALLAEHSITSK